MRQIITIIDKRPLSSQEHRYKEIPPNKHYEFDHLIYQNWTLKPVWIKVENRRTK